MNWMIVDNKGNIIEGGFSSRNAATDYLDLEYSDCDGYKVAKQPC